MGISTDANTVERAPATIPTQLPAENQDPVITTEGNGQHHETSNGKMNEDALQPAATSLPKASIDISRSANTSNKESLDFEGDVNTNNDVPTREILKQVEDMTVLDRDGKVVQFKSLYTGPNVTRRVLIIFIRHFFCGVGTPSSTLRILEIIMFADNRYRIARNTSAPSPLAYRQMTSFNCPHPRSLLLWDTVLHH
jgi:hypothetical protein